MIWRRRFCRAGFRRRTSAIFKRRSSVLLASAGRNGFTGRSSRRCTAFDTKYAMHMLRLGFQGIELFTTGRLSLPMREPERSFLLEVRRGKVSEEDCFTRAGELEQELTDLAASDVLPERPDEAQVEEWMLDAYRRSWRLWLVRLARFSEYRISTFASGHALPNSRPEARKNMGLRRAG